jgi:hypothetical protein
MTKFQRILVAILIAQLALAAFVLWPRPSASGPVKPLMSDIKADDITSLTIQDDKGTALKLVRQGNPSSTAAAGAGQAGWVLPEAGDYPVDATKLTPLLAKLAGLKADRPVAQTPASQKRLQVADDAFQRRVDISTSGGAKRTLLVGSGAGGQSSHVRVGGQNEVYLASDLPAWELNVDPAFWIDTTYVKVTPTDVVGFSLANSNGQWNFTVDDKGAWAMEGLASGEQLDANQVKALINQITSLRMTRPLGKTDDPAYGLAQPAALLTLKAKSGDAQKVYTLAIGTKDAVDSSYVVKLSDSPYYVRVAEFSVRDLVEKKRDGFLQVPPTAQPSAGTPQAPAPAS